MECLCTLVTIVLLMPNADVEALSSELYGRDVQKARKAFDSLSSLTATDEPEVARKSQAVLREYLRQRAKFLLDVGNPDLKSVENATFVHIETEGEIDPADICLLYNLRRLNNVSVKAPHFGDQHLQRLCGIRELMILTVSGTQVKGKSLLEVELPELRALRLEDSPITDDIATKLDLGLDVLSLSGTRISNHFLADCKMTNIKALYFYETAITKDGMRHLSRFRNLIEIRMDLRMFDDSVFSEVEAGKLGLKRVRLRCDDVELSIFEDIEKKSPANCKLSKGSFYRTSEAAK